MLLRLHNDAIDNTGLCCREFLLYNKMAWGMKWEIIKNTECYKGIDLINASGTVKINIANDSYITYGSSIVKVFTTILVQFENGKGTNKKLQNTYDFVGDIGVSIEISKTFNISPQQVRKIKLGISWKHIVV